MQWPASTDVGNHCIPFTFFYFIYFLALVNVLYLVTVNEVYGNSILHVFRIYGFCKGDEGL